MHLQGKLTDVRNKANAQQGNNKKKKKNRHKVFPWYAICVVFAVVAAGDACC